MTTLNKYNIHINTRQRISGDPDSFVIQLETPIIASSSRTHFEIFITSIEYPFNFYQVNSNNNTFVSRLFTFGVLTSTVTITITPGNYNIITLLEKVKDSILTAFGLPFGDIQTSYSKTTGRATFNTSDPNYWFECQFGGTTIGLMLGFTSTITIKVNDPQTGTQHVNVNPTTFFTIRSPELVSANQDMESITERSGNSDILAKVPIRSPPGTYIYYEQPFEDRVYSRASILSNISFYVTGNRTRDLIGNGGLDWSFTLCIMEVMNPEQETHNLIGNMEGGAPVDLSLIRDRLVENLKDLKDQLEAESE